MFDYEAGSSMPVPARAAPSGSGFLANLLGPVGKVAKMVAPFLHKPTPMEEMQARLVAVQLSKALADGMTSYAVADWEHIAPTNRSDHIIIGSRGAGKTAFCALLAQRLAAELEQPVFAVDWPHEAANALGFRTPSDRATWTQARKAIVLLDEAKLRIKDADLWELMALARQRGVSIIYTTQTLAALTRDALRLDATLWARRLDPLAARFEREEVTDLAAKIVAVQSSAGFTKERPALVMRVTEPLVVSASPLPIGWTEDVSRLWS